MPEDQPFQDVLKGNICLSGGAKGADAQWGMNAGRDGQSVIHWSFEKAKVHVPEQEVVRLSQEQLDVADEHLKKANKTLKRYLSFHKPWIINLLRRNYYQVAWCQSLYAVGKFDPKGKVDGGTAWAVQMFLDLHPEGQFEPLSLYFYDQTSEQWFTWAGAWKALSDPPPKPQGIWAGIGSRDLSPKGKWAIRNLFGWFEETTLNTM
jgi:hypothetical protein